MIAWHESDLSEGSQDAGGTGPLQSWRRCATCGWQPLLYAVVWTPVSTACLCLNLKSDLRRPPNSVQEHFCLKEIVRQTDESLL